MTRYSILAKPLPAPVRALPHLLKATCLLLIFTLASACVGPQGMVLASNVKPAVDIVTQRHDAMIRGELDPSTLGGASPAEIEVLRRTALRSSEMLRDVVDTAAAQPTGK